MPHHLGLRGRFFNPVCDQLMFTVSYMKLNGLSSSENTEERKRSRMELADLTNL